MSSKITNIQKQNDSIYSSLVARNILFERSIISDNINDEDLLILLNEENNRLKECIKNNKPVVQSKEDKKLEIIKPINKKEDDDITYEDPVKNFETITNMEDLKRAFFNNEYDTFETQLKANQFRYYKANYKYNSDKDGVPEFSAKNLLKGFVRNFDDYRKYFMICFRCSKNSCQGENTYKYDSLWIVNTNEPINNIIDSMYDDFDFEELTDVDQFISDIKKIIDIDNTEYIGESYVH